MDRKPMDEPAFIWQDVAVKTEHSLPEENFTYIEGNVTHIGCSEEEDIVIKQEIMEVFDKQIEPTIDQYFSISNCVIKEEKIEEPNTKATETDSLLRQILNTAIKEEKVEETDIKATETDDDLVIKHLLSAVKVEKEEEPPDDEPVVKQEIVWVDEMNAENNGKINFKMETDCLGYEGTSNAGGGNTLLPPSCVDSVKEELPVGTLSVKFTQVPRPTPLTSFVAQPGKREYKIGADGSLACKWCRKTFASLKLWYQHKLMSHMQKPPDTSCLLKCDRCNCFFKSQKGYRGHLKSHHSVVDKPSPVNDKNNTLDPDEPDSSESEGNSNEKPVEGYDKLVASIIERVKKECEARGSVSRRGYTRRKTVMNS